MKLSLDDRIYVGLEAMWGISFGNSHTDALIKPDLFWKFWKSSFGNHLSVLGLIDAISLNFCISQKI